MGSTSTCANIKFNTLLFQKHPVARELFTPSIPTGRKKALMGSRCLLSPCDQRSVPPASRLLNRLLSIPMSSTSYTRGPLQTVFCKVQNHIPSHPFTRGCSVRSQVPSSAVRGAVRRARSTCTASGAPFGMGMLHRTPSSTGIIDLGLLTCLNFLGAS